MEEHEEGSFAGLPQLPSSIPKDGAMSTLMDLTVVLLICPAALAAWADTRFPQLRPREVRRTSIHLGVIGVIGFVVMRPLLNEIFALLTGPVGRVTALCVACAVI